MGCAIGVPAILADLRCANYVDRKIQSTCSLLKPIEIDLTMFIASEIVLKVRLDLGERGEESNQHCRERL